jgi:LmbE family N-acetylglucosaminyl deacetylase
MSTLVCFHAHPDDECITTAGIMAQARELGHRVVLVLATRGELGEVPEGFLDDGEQLGDRRTTETLAAAEVIGADRVEFLGYRDSGMAGEPTNDDPGCFWTADVDEAAERLAVILAEEQPDVFVIYDDHGAYFHPDHIQVHRVGARASQLVPIPTVLEATLNRDLFRRGREAMEATDNDEPDADRPPDAAFETWGTLEVDITHSIDVTDYVDVKRSAMRAHASQIAEESFWLSMDDEAFATGFGHEWFVDHRTARVDGQPFITSIWGDTN